MPIKGMILIFLIAVLLCLAMRDEIYKSIKKFFENNIDDDDDKERGNE